MWRNDVPWAIMLTMTAKKKAAKKTARAARAEPLPKIARKAYVCGGLSGEHAVPLVWISLE